MTHGDGHRVVSRRGLDVAGEFHHGATGLHVHLILETFITSEDTVGIGHGPLDVHFGRLVDADP